MIAVSTLALACVLQLASPSAEALAFIQKERERHGVAPLERSPVLDRIALERARQLSARPPGERNEPQEPVDRTLRDSELPPYRAAVDHVDVRSDRTPGHAFARLWRTRPESWNRAMSRSMDSIGLATVDTGDGRRLFLAILVDVRETPDDLEALERRLLGELNSLRAGRETPALAIDGALTEVARRHIAALAAAGSLTAPDAPSVGDRLRADGVPFARFGVSVARNRNADDPVATAIDQWSASPGNLKRLTDGAFSRAGAGVAVDEDGRFYFTVVLTRPDPSLY